MPLDKYLFNPGDSLPAENVDSIDPDNYIPQAAGYLTGGNNISALSVFQSLAIGANNGKIKINVDGTLYDNVAVDLFSSMNSAAVFASRTSSTYHIMAAIGEAITMSAKNKLFSMNVRHNSYSYTGLSFKIRVRQTNASGTILAESNTVAFSTSSSNYQYTFTFSGANAIDLLAGQVYYFETVLVAGGSSNGFLGPNKSPAQPWYELLGSAYRTPNSLDEVAAILQSAIRAVTGKTETVVWSTDHFVITSATTGRDSQILKLMTPSTGTDISGAGATPYLDMADNATETQGTGEEYKLVRLNDEGLVPKEIIQIDSGDNYVANPIALNTVYQNTASYPIVVSFTAIIQVGSGGTDTGIYAKIGTTSTPNILVGQSITKGNAYTDSKGFPMIAIVPAGQYYKFETYGNGSGVTLISSCSYQLL